jgi:hypothetical protein
MRQLLDWARSERDRIGLRAVDARLRTDAPNLDKVLTGRRRASRRLLKRLEFACS